LIAPARAYRDEAKRVATLAWPVVVGQIGLVAMGTVDMLMVGHLGAEPLAAIGIANTWSFAALILGLGACSGLDPFFSQAYGAGRPKDAGEALIRGSVFVSAVALLIIGFHLLARPGLSLLMQPESLLSDASLYCRIMAVAVIPYVGFALIKQFLQGSGVMRPAMWVIAVGNLVNIAANWVFIYGNLGAEPMGVPGAAWSTAVVRWVMFAVLAAVARPHIRAAWPERLRLWDLQAYRKLAFTAMPVSLQWGLEVWAFNTATIMAGWLGSNAVAAHTAAQNITAITFMIPLGIGAAAATRTGNLVGARHPWSRAAWTSLGLGAASASVAATVFTLFPEALAQLYNPDPQVISLMVLVLPIGAIFQWVDAGQVISFGVLRGLGDTRKPLLINVVGYWLIGIPAGYYMAFHLDYGLRGVWWGVTISLTVACVLLVARIVWHSSRSPSGAAAGLDAENFTE